MYAHHLLHMYAHPLLPRKVFNSGKFFGVEGVLISRRFDYEVQ
jgi:hypothetical protein